MVEDICIHLEATKPRQPSLIFCRSVKNFMQAENNVKKLGCVKYPESKSSFRCPNYQSYIQAYNKINKVV
jgi:hypothetical protein